jgi:hypothetical protein
MVNQPSAARRRVGEYHGPRETIKERTRRRPYSRPARAAASALPSGGSPERRLARFISLISIVSGSVSP